ncbi:SusD/RagB family nutrient-binding outer membrane lipoprotein [Chryseobacterium lactis]|uniref:SusD/RagB family nutrient-binding outer membrane lipoprotein n=1 Tax=Chryseobacterium lactis TaxID=1241981 RepID=A0A3G6RR56_CHRLC|nr:SusD/RagB family nutrient-binding outer membrane lipoprotein [Chryseobacterium lactis]AZA80717.1 SusD/RagB family nutrient-binding outer membrane lipoprotein [Chryseobacterium lactis]AZB05719.1 SusD/RagB family nutrient-binding outer membrane lipoprotein [Chryseobacterium lactis]PNW13561.1 SusD/RagB family nutrient-binding outer membrane lipoprotein [Chryseobacterium lactis]
MKKYILTSLVAMLFVGCQTADDVNSDPHATYETTPEALITYAQKELSDYMTTPSVNENNFRLTMQYWQETIYVNESNYDFTNRNVSNNVWIDNYVNVLKNLDQAKRIINAYVPTFQEAATWPGIKQNQLAVIDIMQVYTFQILVDTYGDIPYTQALDIDKYPLPKYDKASDIYTSLIDRLKTDITNLSEDSDAFGSGDVFYKGDISKWEKFGNSLLLKLGMSLADVNPTLAQATVNQAISGGVMNASGDDCKFQYLDSSPNENPVYQEVTSRNDFIAGKTLVDYMKSTNDTRISVYYRGPIGGQYIGQIIGAPGAFGSFSKPGTFTRDATTPGILLSYTEVAFYLAEAAARWGIGGSPSALYTTAVTSSFSDWGKDADAAAYLAAHPYDASNWKKSIGEQAWVAMYNQAVTSWNFYRRLDYPQLVAPTTAIPNAGGKVPVRLQYPPAEATTNGSNSAAASAAIGGDKLTTKIFWDVN